ncbi:unnamed protein product, partial [Callosobruchus maculatus]
SNNNQKGSNISNLRFADDTTSITASEEELVAIFNILEQHSAAYGLGINYKRTKIESTIIIEKYSQ